MTKSNSDPYQPSELKQKIIKVSPMALVSILMENNKIGIVQGIPAGTRYVGGGYDAATNCFFLHVENERFEGTKVGERLPDVPIKLEDLNQTKEK